MLKHVSTRRYWFVLFAIICLLFMAALMQEHIIINILFVLSLLGIFGSLISTVWSAALPRALAIFFASIAVIGGLLHYIKAIPIQDVHVGLIICCFSYSAFILIAAISVCRHVFLEEHNIVSANRIVGSVCVYMLLGMFFAFIYAAMGLINNSMFQFGSVGLSPNISGLRDFIYFSYATLTTTGYGDMVPTHPISRMLSCIESIVGSVYLAIMVAYLVGMHVSQRHAKTHSHEHS